MNVNKFIAFLLVPSLIFMSGCTSEEGAQNPPVQATEEKSNEEKKHNPESEMGAGEKNQMQSEEKRSEQKPADQPKVVLENEAFRIFEPSPNSEVKNRFVVRGEARVFEASLSYTFEDGHNVLAEGHVMASEGAPGWGKFEIIVQFDKASSPYGVLSLYELSAKDGSRIHELHLPVRIKKEFFQKP